MAIKYKFKYPCVIWLNEKFIREEIEKMGYRNCAEPKFDFRQLKLVNREDRYLRCSSDILDTISDEDLREVLDFEPGIIECGGNVELFLAIAAINDENDYMQWFKSSNDNSHYKCSSEKNQNTEDKKLSLEEIIAKFSV